MWTLSYTSSGTPLVQKQNKINNLYFSVNNCALHLARRQKTMLCCLCCLASVFLFESRDTLHGVILFLEGLFVSNFKMHTKHHFRKVGPTGVIPLYPQNFTHLFSSMCRSYTWLIYTIGSNLPILLRITSPRYSKPFHCKVGSCKNQAFAGSHTYKASTLTIVIRCRYFEG